MEGVLVLDRQLEDSTNGKFRMLLFHRRRIEVNARVARARFHLKENIPDLAPYCESRTEVARMTPPGTNSQTAPIGACAHAFLTTDTRRETPVQMTRKLPKVRWRSSPVELHQISVVTRDPPNHTADVRMSI